MCVYSNTKTFPCHRSLSNASESESALLVCEHIQGIGMTPVFVFALKVPGTIDHNRFRLNIEWFICNKQDARSASQVWNMVSLWCCSSLLGSCLLKTREALSQTIPEKHSWLPSLIPRSSDTGASGWPSSRRLAPNTNSKASTWEWDWTIIFLRNCLFPR